MTRPTTARRAQGENMLARLLRSAGMAVLLAVSAAMIAPSALAQPDPNAAVAAADATLSNFMRDPDMDWLQRNFHRAKAVLISPEIVKAGFIFGGSGGRGVVLARDPKTGKWAGPAFYNLATASVGFQAGIAVSEGVALVMTDK